MRTYAAWVVRHRFAVVAVTIVVTALLANQVKRLRVIVDPDTLAPAGHPYIVASHRIASVPRA